MVSPVSSAPRPSEPAAQCSTAAPSKWPPMRASVTPGSTSTRSSNSSSRSSGAGSTARRRAAAARARRRRRRCRRGRRRSAGGRCRSVSMPPAAAIALPRGVVEQRDRVPQHVAVRGAHEQGALPDPDLRGDADPEQVGLLLADLAGVVARRGPRRSSSAGRPSRRTGARPRRSGSCAGGSAVSGYCTAQVAQIHAGMKDRRHGVSAAGKVWPVVSTITLGTMGYGGRGWAKAVGELDVDAAQRQIGMARDAGVNLIDTADVYSEGVCEEIVGKALGASRDDVLLATKVRLPMGDGPNDAGPLPPPRDPRRRGQPAQARHRLDRPLPGARVGRRHPAGGDPRRAGPPRAVGQGALHRLPRTTPRGSS